MYDYHKKKEMLQEKYMKKMKGVIVKGDKYDYLWKFYSSKRIDFFKV